MPWVRYFSAIVPGHAEPAGSKRAFTPGGNGRPIVVDANPKAKDWKIQVARIVSETYTGPVLDEPLMVRFNFVRPRPASHFGSGRNAGKLKDSAPQFPATAPDALKLARGVEDALSGVIYRDDSRIVSEMLNKRWGERPRVEIEIFRWHVGTQIDPKTLMAYDPPVAFEPINGNGNSQ